MNKLITGIVNLFLNKQMDALKLTINVLLYITLLYENRTDTFETMYNKLTTDFFNEIKKSYNFDFEIINMDQLRTLLNVVQLNEIFDKKYDYIELILQLYSSKRINKELYNYCTDTNVIKHMIKQIPTHECNCIINLFSGTGGFMEHIIKNNITYKNMFCVDNNEFANIICKLNMRLQLNKHFNSIIQADILKTELLIGGDVIICDIPTNIKNLTYAECCEDIKKLKMRGTKSEPLIIQLITTLLETNGTAIVLVSNNFLYRETIQHNMTRKYLVNNFNVTNIINVANLNKSIVIFNNKAKTNIIHFSNIENNYNIDVPVSDLSEAYILSIDHYHDVLSDSTSINDAHTKCQHTNEKKQLDIPQTRMSHVNTLNTDSQRVKSIRNIDKHVSTDLSSNTNSINTNVKRKYHNILDVQKLNTEKKIGSDAVLLCISVNDKIVIVIRNILRRLESMKDKTNTNLINDFIEYYEKILISFSNNEILKLVEKNIITPL